MNYLFLTGMFRSGTTLLARMLNTHSQVACASDPMRPLFNSFRYTISDEKYKRSHGRYHPLDDYFLSDTELFKKMLFSIDLHVKVDEQHEKLLNIIKQDALPYSGEWARSLKIRSDLSSYHEIVGYFLDAISNVYGRDKDVSVTAFKEVWTNEIVPAFLNTFSESKAIIVVRDPRAVIASNNVTKAKYPLFFLTRQWRKSVFIAKYLEKQFPEKTMILRYEDLLQYPETVIQKICHFCNIPFEVKLLDSSNYLDGDNKPWKQNTSYKEQSKRNINKDSINKWTQILEKPDLLLIDLICHDWMRIFDYEGLYSTDQLLSEKDTHFRRYKIEELSEWVRPYSFDQDNETYKTELIKEKLRLHHHLSEVDYTNDEEFALQSSRSSIFYEGSLN
jgi:hypothetical protein